MSDENVYIILSVLVGLGTYIACTVTVILFRLARK